jgi:hypothetical protein
MTVALQLLDQERLLSKMLLAFRYVPFAEACATHLQHRLPNLLA